MLVSGCPFDYPIMNLNQR